MPLQSRRTTSAPAVHDPACWISEGSAVCPEKSTSDELRPAASANTMAVTAMIAKLESLEPLVGHHSPKATRFCTAGMEHLSTGR